MSISGFYTEGLQKVHGFYRRPIKGLKRSSEGALNVCQIYPGFLEYYIRILKNRSFLEGFEGVLEHIEGLR